MYRTSDAGSSWTSAATLPAGISAVSFLDQKHWIGFNGSYVVRTVDGGATWTDGGETRGGPRCYRECEMACPSRLSIVAAVGFVSLTVLSGTAYACPLNVEWQLKIDEGIAARSEEDPERLQEIREMLKSLPVKVTFASGWPGLG